jgi:hypothetical protein
MPVIATPNSVPRETCCDPLSGATGNPSVVSCAGLNVLVVEPTTKFKKPLFERIQTVRITGGQEVKIQWTMRDRAGNPVDLSDCACVEGSSSSLVIDESSNSSLTITCSYRIVFRITEHLLLGSCARTPVEIEGTIVDAANGVVQIIIPADMTTVPGIYYGEIALVSTTDGVDTVYFSNSFYVAIEKSRWATGSQKGPPTFAEIRLHLRDSSPAENVLLNELAFDDAEIAYAIGRPVEYWNEIPPDVRRYTTQTFPHRFHWMEGIAASLFQIAAEGYRKNHLAYSAAGVSIDDQNKEPNYEQASARGWAVYKDFVRRKKAEINLNAAYGTVGSDYGRMGSGF